MSPPFRQSLFWKYKPVPELVRLAWPIAVSMLSYSVMTLVDTLFVGRLGASALAAVGIGGVTSFTLICFGFGALRSAKVVVSQAVGAGRDGEVRAVLSAAVALALALGALAVFGGRLVARVLPDLVQHGDAGVLAAEYLWVRNLGAPLALVAIALKETRYGLGDTKAPMVATLAANVTNVGLDALFIWGFGLGVRGAAWATVAGYLVEASLLLWISLRSARGLSPVRWREVSRLLALGLPLGLQFVLEVGSFSVMVALLARTGEVNVAAHQIALQLCHFSFLPAMALGEAASVLVGQAVGADEDELVRPVARRALGLASAYTGSCALAFVLLARPLAHAFTSDPRVVALTVQLLYVAAVFQLFDGANGVARSVLRGTGDVRFPAVIAVTIAWLCTPTFTWLLGVRLGLGALGGWLGLCAEIVAGAAVLWWRLERGGWRPAAQRSRAELEARPKAPAIVAAA